MTAYLECGSVKLTARGPDPAHGLHGRIDHRREMPAAA